MRAASCFAQLGALILLWLTASRGSAQTLTTLLSFSGTSGTALGANPIGVLTLSGSTLYGTTEGGGESGYGTVFSIPTSGGSLATLASFGGTNGRAPVGGLALSGSTLYGATSIGGTGDCGTVFSVPVCGGSATTLVSFDEAHGEYPNGGVTLSGSTLYGTTLEYGLGSEGTVFSIATTGGNLATMVAFGGDSSIGGYPAAGLTLNGSTLYGTTSTGGSGAGVVFSIATSGGSPRGLLSPDPSNGQYLADSNVALSGPNLYVTTGNKSAMNALSILSVPTSGGTATTVLSRTGTSNPIIIDNPYAAITLSGSTIYGVTEWGGAYAQGDIFEVQTDGTGYQELFAFDGQEGAYPIGGLTLSGSTLFGTTYAGGANGDGTVFALNLNPTPEPSTFALLAAGAIGLAGYVWRKRRAARQTAKPAAFDEQDAPARRAA